MCGESEGWGEASAPAEFTYYVPFLKSHFNEIQKSNVTYMNVIKISNCSLLVDKQHKRWDISFLTLFRILSDLKYYEFRQS